VAVDLSRTCTLIGMLLSLLIKVENKRLDAEELLAEKGEKPITETTRLMDEDAF